jgi:hypothetical protein
MSRITKNVNVDEMAVVFNFGHGPVQFRIDELPQEMVDRLVLHGLSQKLGDSYASAGATGADPYECAQKVWDNLIEGNWGAERGSGLEDKLAEAHERLAKYDALSDDQKRLMAGLKVTRSGIEKEIKSIEKAIERRDKAEK